MRIKKFWASTLVLAMTFGLVSCGSSTVDNNPVTADVEEQSAGNATASDAPLEAEGEEVDPELQQAILESSLTGTGPATLEDTLKADESDEVQLNDGDAIIDLDFDDDKTDGFNVYTNGGSCDMKNEDGQLVADIKKCGSLEHANQLYWDGFALNKNCEYTYSFEISSDIERPIEYRLQINGGDYHAYQGEVIDIGPDVTYFSVDFEMTEESDPSPRLVFNMGKIEGMDSDPGEHKVYIDNIKLEVMDGSNAAVIAGLPTYVNVAVNQIGYKPEDVKTAVVKSDKKDDEEFIICEASTNKTVYAGILEPAKYDKGAELGTKKADFTDLTTPGEYYVFTDKGASYTFKIEDEPYSDIYNDAVQMLYKQRCGTETDAAYAGDFAHKACHTGEAKVYDDQSKSKDVSGGWHDAGDYGRYVVSGAVAVADLLEAYEDFDVTADNLGIPESGNEIPDILDEAKYELEWMLKMQDEESGGVYHKVTGLTFPGTVKPEEEKEQLYLAPISQAATGDFAAVMAKASVVYKEIDPEFSSKALGAAEKAWDYLVSDEEDKSFKNPEDMDTGEYPDEYIQDERYWAAVELYLAGNKDIEEYVVNYRGLIDMKKGLGWADVGSYADYDLAKYTEGEIRDMAIQHISEKADSMAEQADKGGYFMTFASDFAWGSNMTIANNGQFLYMASNVTGDENYAILAKQQLDYLLGTNSLGYCFVTGYGTFSPKTPHHRPSEVEKKAMSGMLVGGSNKNLEDPYASAVLSGASPAMCYVDNAQSYSTNETAIYWNSPLIYLLSAQQKVQPEDELIEEE
ncbi:MAG: glycoside hydrolase family 9 protein [Eubacterium sp.]|nr:glycoside hydrolase family 9 protein [Eubacterium sp.]